MAGSKPIIAVVDDEASVLQALRRLLCADGFAVETYSSASDLLDSLHQRQPDSPLPDCLILDLQMPRLGGLAAQARLAACGIALPVVVITGHDTNEGRAHALAQGAAAYLRKPVDESLLLAAIADALGGSIGPERP